MNKWLSCILIIALSAVIFVPAVLAASQVQVVVDGQMVAFPDEPPYVDHKSNRTMVPARFVSEKLGAKLNWNGKLNQVTFSFKDKTIILTIGRNHAQVNGKAVTFDTPAVVKNSRTMVPLRFISEIFRAQVEWNAERNLAVVTTSSKIPKGTWIWDSSIIEKDRDKIISFASDHDVTAIYLQINRDMDPKVYQDFIRSAKGKQIRVEALAGRPEWAFKKNQDQMNTFITWTLQYNASVGPKERFDGLHFDIEPYLLTEWKTNNKMILDEWIHNLRFIENKTKGSGLKVTLDVPYWINSVKVPGTEYSFSAWLLEKFDGLVIMDYRNHALGKNGIVDNAIAILREASTLNKQVIVAVETAKNTESDRTSFYSKRVDFMEQELRTAHQKLSQHASYAGMAIHDYKSWTAMGGK
ncbi:copper amine oxidase N-terminal domain-containing protein [Paenibacillus mendelii]|uniref:Copper amine oxidase N-terminal domain-containing protein n=1 Tax=Paenibacillus mendelii TaxID=206163 RepID=A0ABV6JCF3_9BACL|nr:copper amine oxidase N-terminal domain-containing protein [Paenibacillus mendelii]MCQ6561574.1 copper amine oxidase N-terminal domain-containing protein [Paenibacillus mendelii]